MDFHVFLFVSFRWWWNSQRPTRRAPQQISVRQSRFSARTCSAFSHMQAQYQPPSCSLPLSRRSQARGQSKVTPQLLPPHRWEVRLINSWWWSSVTASSKYPTMSLPSGTQLLSRGHLILFVMYRGVLFVSPQRLMGTYPWSYMCSVNVMQCRVPLLHSLFQAGNVVTFHLWFGFFPPPSPGSQGLTTRCSENRAVAVPSFKVPSDRLQSFLYRHQYGEHDLNNGCFFFWLFSDSVLTSFLSRVWSIMERVMVWKLHRSFTGFRRLESDLSMSAPSTFLPSFNTCSWWECSFLVT